jgi:hypothetical protein
VTLASIAAGRQTRRRQSPAPFVSTDRGLARWSFGGHTPSALGSGLRGFLVVYRRFRMPAGASTPPLSLGGAKACFCLLADWLELAHTRRAGRT